MHIPQISFYHHDKLDWVGVSISPTISRRVVGINNISGKSFVRYDCIPHKEVNYVGLVLNWPGGDSDRTCYSILQNEGMKFQGSIKQKYDNTLKFYNDISNAVYYTSYVWSLQNLHAATVKYTEESRLKQFCCPGGKTNQCIKNCFG
jgi:hypothetical protein